MIAILAAMSEEVSALKALMTDIKEECRYGSELTFGKLANKDVVLLKSGVGKTEAATRATMIIAKYDIDYLINIGSSGSLDETIKIGSIIIPTMLGYHDLDVDDDAWTKDFTDERHTFYPDERLLKVAQKINDDTIFYGPHVSGDAFVYRKEQIAKIKSEFPRAKSCEMEATSIANACTIMGTPFIIIRSISDVVTKEDSHVDYDNFLELACKKSAEYCKRFIYEVNDELA